MKPWGREGGRDLEPLGSAARVRAQALKTPWGCGRGTGTLKLRGREGRVRAVRPEWDGPAAGRSQVRAQPTPGAPRLRRDGPRGERGTEGPGAGGAAGGAAGTETDAAAAGAAEARVAPARAAPAAGGAEGPGGSGGATRGTAEKRDPLPYPLPYSPSPPPALTPSLPPNSLPQSPPPPPHPPPQRTPAQPSSPTPVSLSASPCRPYSFSGSLSLCPLCPPLYPSSTSLNVPVATLEWEDSGRVLCRRRQG